MAHPQTYVPYDYQVEAINFLKVHPNAMLADKQGMGKTVMMLFVTRDLNGPGIIVCRPLAKPYWRKMIKAIDPSAEICTSLPGGIYNEEKVQSWFGNPNSPDPATHKRKRGYLLLHHEALATPYKPGGGVQRDIASKLIKYGIWEFIVADEAHRFKNRKAQMSRSLKRISCSKKWALTGTPQDKSPADFWSLLNWFDSEQFRAYWPFYDYYVDYYNLPHGGRAIIGPKNLNHFAERVAPYYLRRETAPGMPQKTITYIPIKLNDKQQALYDRLESETVLSLTDDPDDEMFIPNALSRIWKLKQMALDPTLLGTDLPSTKIQWINDWMTDYPDRPFVIFSQVKKFINALPINIPNCVTISGDVAQVQRDYNLSAFQDGTHDVRVLAGTIDTMSESINLQRASIAIFTDMHRSSIAMRQAEDRIHRIDSPGPVQILHLIAEKTIDEIYLEGLNKKLTDAALVARFLEKHKVPIPQVVTSKLQDVADTVNAI
jgi:SNF2 family DNA or RNA helicase